MTARPFLCLTNVCVRRAPGFVDGGFDVGELSAGVNLIYGPNASGKTTLSRAIRTLLWPDPRERRVSLSGAFSLDGAKWLLDFDAGRMRVQRDGHEADLPRSVPAESQDRYTLALHDLLKDDNQAFADAIQRESSGGYDLRGAAELLWPAVPRPRKLEQELRQAGSEHQSARKQQQELVERENALQELYRRRAQIERTRQHQQLIERALRYSSSRANVEVAQRRRSSFPSELARFHENVPQRLGELRGQLEEQQRRAEELDAQLKVQAARCAELRLGDDAAWDVRLDSLGERCRQLAERTRMRGEQDACFQQAVASLEEIQRRLARDARPEQLARLDADTVEQLFELAQRDLQLRAQGQAEEALLEWLGATPEPEDAETLRRGIELLQDWLARGDGVAGRRLLQGLAVAGGVLVALESLALAYWSHAAWLVLLPCGVGIAVWGWFGSAAKGTQIELQNEFEHLSLATPATWDRAAIRDVLATLQRRVASAKLDDVKRERCDKLRPRLEQFAQQKRQLASKCDALAEQVGLDPRQSTAALAVLADNLRRWQEAQVRRREAEAARDAAARACDEILQTLNAELEQCGCAPARDATETAAQVKSLERRLAEWREAETDARHLRESLETCRKQQARLDEQFKHWRAEIGLPEATDAEILELARQYPDYRKAVGELELAERELEVADQALAEHPDLKEEPLEALQQKLRDASQIEAELQSLSEVIGAIEQKIREAKRKADVEELLAKERTAADALRGVRDQKSRETVGRMLQEYVQAESQQHDRPAVFERARVLFARITHGRYELTLDEQPAFRALDTSTGVGHALEELSSGTRLQLLLAVRVAFVEQQEHGPCLPMVLDETLGNSDERRAGEMIDATIEICRTGRQLFYLTAQQDELAKWKARLDDQGIDYRLIDLAERRGFSEVERLPALPPVAPPPAVPAPDEVDHAGYRSRLNVPAFDPHRPVGAVHLWYLVHDPADLYELLQLGINNWGQLQALAGTRPATLEPFEATIARARVLARALDEFAKSWCVGRGRRVDRTVLLDADGVSDAFIDAVDELARSVDGDAQQLLDALESRAVKNFRTSAVESLRAYLLEHGYLDTVEVLDADGVRTRVLLPVLAELEAGRVTSQQLNYLLSLVDERFRPEPRERRPQAASGALF